MSYVSPIEWTEATWNPTRGCRKISPGCKHCYAERIALRFAGVTGNAYEQGFEPRLAPATLANPLRWATPRIIFTNSMSDVFLDDYPADYIEVVCRVMELADWHVFQVLTKRAERMESLLNGRLAHFASLPNIWWGVSVEDRKHGLPRVEHLRRTRVRTRFLSIEPLIEDLGRIDLTGIHWAILGGESGPGARPLLPDWARALRDACTKSNVPFFFKQWGGVQKKATGRSLDGRTWDEMPAIVRQPVPRLETRRERLREIAAVVRDWELTISEGPAADPTPHLRML